MFIKVKCLLACCLQCFDTVHCCFWRQEEHPAKCKWFA